MNVARSLERQLERLLEGVFGRVFSGRLHASEIATRIAREADLARFDHESGPATANNFTLTFNPKDIDSDGSVLADSLTESFGSYIVDTGLRLVGPPRVDIKIDDNVVSGQFLCHLEIVPGPQEVWGRLSAKPNTYLLKANRSIIGRSESADVTIPSDDISRRHALIWRAKGSTWIVDLDSSNGTVVDGERVKTEPAPLSTGSVIQLGSARFRFIESPDA